MGEKIQNLLLCLGINSAYLGYNYLTYALYQSPNIRLRISPQTASSLTSCIIILCNEYGEPLTGFPFFALEKHPGGCLLLKFNLPTCF